MAIRLTGLQGLKLPFYAEAGFLEKQFSAKEESLWKDLGARGALRLFHAAADRVPAYKDFLKKHHVVHARVKSIKDLSSVPVTDTQNYISAYPLYGRCWDGKLSSSHFVATSSGTKGDPKFWPRSGEQDFEAALIHEFLYRTYFNIHKRSTLLLIGFPMGIYISGIATLLPSWLTSLKGRGSTVLSIGNNKAEMLRTVRNLSGEYEQTILIGHPFFIKDVLETGAREGIAWSKKNLGLMFCSEGFTEEWRQYVMKIAGISQSSMRVFNTYGSSEMLLMAYETPFTIKLKKLVERSPQFLETLMSDTVPAQFFQYNPVLRYVESVQKELIFTSASGIPLIRFNLHDRGVILGLGETEKAAHMTGKHRADFRLPLLALWGRSDDTLKFHAVNVYPEHIKAGLADKRFLRVLTGKFTMRKFLGKKMDQFLEINVELGPHLSATKGLERKIGDHVVKKLFEVNLEYADMASHINKDVRPRIVLWPYQHSRYFKPGLKPRYIDRQ